MTRQNCKNCGEPYTFDNLVTPGRATMVCSACQKKIYVHTGQIYFEAPVSQTSVNSSVKISLGQGVSIVKTSEEIKNAPIDNGKKLTSQQWKSFDNNETRSTKSSIHIEPEIKEEDMELSLYQWVIVLALYGLFIAWVVVAIRSLILLPNDADISIDTVRAFIISSTFAIFCLAIAELCKWVWRRL